MKDEKRNKGIKNSLKEISFDMDLAKESMEGFVFSCDVPCTLYSNTGKELKTIAGNHSNCSFCKEYHDRLEKELPCNQLHVYGAFEAERIGGRYIYACPADLFFFASPIMIEGAFAGFMTAGPLGMPDTDEILDSEIFSKEFDKLRDEDRKSILEEISNIRCANPRTVKAISGQLFMTCLYVSDSMHEMYLAKNNAENDSKISEVLVSLEPEGDKKNYPSDVEFELFNAISKKDSKKAGELLNEILGYIFLYYKSTDEIKARVTQIFTIISRAAVFGGASGEYIFNVCDNYIVDLQNKTNITSILRWSAENTGRFINLIFELIGQNRTSPISLSINYINENCSEKITLEEVAERVGYSATYFSKVFKEEVGETFKNYLIRMRIEKSKILLLTTMLPISDISIRAGFSDQSYFCKIFRQMEGVTPNKFRSRSRRIDSTKEKVK